MDLSRAFEYGQGYVALSRVRAFSGLHILGINQRAFEVHPLVLERDQAFRERSEDAERGFEDMPPSELLALHNNFITAMGGTIHAMAIDDAAKAPKISTYEQTLAHVELGKTLAEIVHERQVTEGTIVKHLEELALAGKLPPLELSKFTGLDPRVLDEIREATLAVEGGYLKPIFEALDEKYSYETIRLVRLETGVPPKRSADTEMKKTSPKVTTTEKPANMGEKWGKQEEEQLIKLFQEGKKTKHIAEELKRMPGGIRSRLKKLGLITP